MKASIIRKNGSPVINIGDKKVYPVSYRTFQPDERLVKDFYNAGYELFQLFPSGILCSLNVPYSNSGEVWDGENKYNWDNLRKHIDKFLNSAPTAKFALLIQLDTRQWYLNENEDAVDSFKNLTLMCKDEKWRSSASSFLKSIIEFVEKEYPDRVYIAHIFAGHTCEWYSYYPKGGFENNERLVKNYADYFGAAEKMPSYDELFKSDNGIFRHPRLQKKAVDFWRFYSEIIVDTIGFFAKKVKEITNGRMLTGCFYGYTMCFFPSYVRGHNAFHSLLCCEDIDVIFSPSAYSPFRLMESSNAFNIAIDSIKLHKKLYIHEIDNTTSLTKGNKFADLLQGLHQRPENVEDSVTYLKRDCARALEHGAGYWWFDMWGGWYDDKTLMENMSKIKKASEVIYEAGTESVSEIAVFIDSYSQLCLADDNPLASAGGDYGAVNAHKQNVYLQQEGLNNIGAPVSYFDLNDILNPSFPHQKYKLYIFPDLYAPSKEVSEKISLLRKERKSFVFIHAPGYIGENDYSFENMKKLTGFNFRIADEISGKTVSSDNLSWGGEKNISPLFTITDNDCEIIGKYEESGLVAAAVKKNEKTIDAWFGSGNVPGSILREIALEAGVFIYSKSDIPLYINKSMLGIYSHKGGKYEIMLPDDELLIDLYNEEKEIKTFEKKAIIDLKKKEFRMFLRKKQIVYK